MSARLGSAHAAYIGGAVPGSSSTFAVMLDRARQQGGVGEPCRACDGTGARIAASLEQYVDELRAAPTEHKQAEVQAKFADCRACRGTGVVADRVRGVVRPDTMFTTVWCGRCRGTGSAYAEDFDDTCPACRHHRSRGEPFAGYRIPITIRETGSSKSGKPPKRASDDEPSYTITDEQMAWYGRLSRKHERLRRTHPTAAAALALFEGPQGARWAQTRWGRIFSLWPLTKAGRKLIDAGRASADRPVLDELELLVGERLADENATHPDRRRRAWIRRADADARRLLDAAQTALSEVT